MDRFGSLSSLKQRLLRQRHVLNGSVGVGEGSGFSVQIFGHGGFRFRRQVLLFAGRGFAIGSQKKPFDAILQMKYTCLLEILEIR